MDTTAKNFIYGYCDPRSGRIRYSGASTVGMHRPRSFNEHCAHCLNWIKSLDKLGLKPEIIILREFSDNTPYEEVFATEIEWIAMLRKIGCDLTNLTDGGEGTRGRKLSVEAKERISQKNTGKKRDDSAKEKMRAAKLGTHRAEEVKASISRNMVGKQNSLGTTRPTLRKQVVCIESSQIFESISAAGKTLKLNPSHIGDVLKGRLKHTGGYTFKYYTPSK
jgi:hypothetical protein